MPVGRPGLDELLGATGGAGNLISGLWVDAVDYVSNTLPGDYLIDPDIAPESFPAAFFRLLAENQPG